MCVHINISVVDLCSCTCRSRSFGSSRSTQSGALGCLMAIVANAPRCFAFFPGGMFTFQSHAYTTLEYYVLMI